MQNPFIWHDLITPDVEAAKTFYGAVVGWTFEAQMPEYHVAKIKEGGMGGIMAQPDNMKGMPPFWSGYIYVTDVDAACAKIKKLGGKVHREPWDVPHVARMAVVGDPTGANFNIMAPIPQGDSKLPPPSALGAVGWNEAHVGELDKAWAFYSDMFGWTKGTVMPMGEMGDYMLFQIDGKDIGGMMKKMEAMPMPMWLYYFNVDGIDAAAARIVAAGGKIAMGPHQVPGGQWIVSGLDPQGGNFSLLSGTK
ncbi:MAG: VOC family protein [Alphaproteobacteria bacterium]|nr:VOC family protein [Alphaproteobacteria bacterium]